MELRIRVRLLALLLIAVALVAAFFWYFRIIESGRGDIGLVSFAVVAVYLAVSVFLLSKYGPEKPVGLFESIKEGIFSVDETMRITQWNKTMQELTRFSQDDVIGRKLTDVMMGKSFDFIKEAIKTGKMAYSREDAVFVTGEGERRSYIGSASPFLNSRGKVSGALVNLRDVSDILEWQKSRGGEFVSLASHQLRAPLAVVKGLAEELVKGDHGDLTRKQKDIVTEILETEIRMDALVNALLNLSRVDTGIFAVMPKTIDVVQVIKEVEEGYSKEAKNKKVKIRESFAMNRPRINADPRILEIALQNLLSNAIKYSKSGDEVVIALDIGGNELIIKVTDEGIGIPREEQEKVFSKLFRAENVRKVDIEGFGLGLYITKSILEAAGCRIWFASDARGTKFYIGIPLSGMKQKEGIIGLV